jgi:hypothetical protein
MDITKVNGGIINGIPVLNGGTSCNTIIRQKYKFADLVN